MNCVVVIPIYKKFVELTNNEIKSILQCFKILKKHQIVFICPEFLIGINLYNDLAKQENTSVKFKEFRNIYFENIDGYNRLLLSHEFYAHFRSFDYMLIYQTDAYVFSDQLDFWCKQGYDYIGAPWFSVESHSNPILTRTGNGGFSLRKISKFISWTRRIAILKYYSRLRDHFNLKKLYLTGTNDFLSRILCFFFKVKKGAPELIRVINSENLNEDMYWCISVNDSFKDFKVPSPNVAVSFSFEMNPSFLYKKNSQKLPFGCHGWSIYEPHFWNQFIYTSH
jgi:hypothetical protein